MAGEVVGEKLRVRILSKRAHGQPTIGEVWYVEGVDGITEWGRQLDAARAMREVPSGRLIRHYLAGSIPGIGHERSARLWKRWGEDLVTVLSDDSRLSEIAEAIDPARPTLALALASSCNRAWKEATTSIQALLWLSNQGIDDFRLSRQVLALLGEAAVATLEENPYVLVALLSWARVDEFGLKVLRSSGIDQPRRDRRRLVGAVDAAIKKAIVEGNTAISQSGLLVAVAKHIGVSIGSEMPSLAISMASAEGAIVLDGDRWRAPGCASMEDAITDRFLLMQSPDYPSEVVLPSRQELKCTLAVMRISGHQIHEEQCDAVLELLQLPLAVLQGGAGVGKTTTLMAVCDLWSNAGGDVVCCTISGKASLRLSRATGRTSLTLARLLRQLGERERLSNEIESLGQDDQLKTKNRLEQLSDISARTLVVIDEASMLDLSTAFELIRHFPIGARLLLVGDEAQLPPVGFGLVFHRLVSDSSLTIRLNHVHRQTTKSGIPGVSASIRDGTVPTLPDYAGKGDGVSLLAATPETLQASVVRVWENLGGRISGTLICTATKSGVAGTNALNALLQRRHSERDELATVRGFYGHWYSPGDPVIWLKNDYTRGLFNGLLGVVQSADPEQGLEVQFEGFSEVHEIAPEQLVDLALAYAITCHRAQGSQAPAIIVPIYESKVLDPSWLYTAITRAERQVVLVGDLAVLREAVTMPWTAKRREIGLRWRT